MDNVLPEGAEPLITHHSLENRDMPPPSIDIEDPLEEKYAVKTNVNDIPYEEDTHSYMQHSMEK